MLKSLTLTNFKSFRSATVDFGPFTVILGTNASGKSNLFDALRFLHFIGQKSSIRDAIDGHAAAGPSGLSVPGVRGGSGSLTYIGGKTSSFQLTSKFRHKRYGTITYRIAVDVPRSKVIREDLTCTTGHPGPYVYTTHPESSPLQQDPDSPGIEARYHRKSQGRNPKKTFSSSESILGQFIGRQADSNVNEAVADVVRQELIGLTPLELRPEILRQYSNLGVFELGEHGENFAALAWLITERARLDHGYGDGISESMGPIADDAVATLETITAWLSELSPHKISGITTLGAPTGEVIFALKEDPFKVPLSARSLSDGTLRFAALAFALFGEDRRRTLLIEEVENGINPARLAILARMLETAARDIDGAQVVATAHAPGLLTFLSRETIKDVIVMGWDYDNECTHPVRLIDLPDIANLSASSTLGELQQEGWLQLAADL